MVKRKDVKDPLKLILREFPPMISAFAYGSGVFRQVCIIVTLLIRNFRFFICVLSLSLALPQAGYSSDERPMVDLVFVVNDAVKTCSLQNNASIATTTINSLLARSPLTNKRRKHGTRKI